MSWRVARSLEVLRDQINAAYPGRNTASDGTIGDAAHQASVSDHNPDAGGVVRALDITHDLDSGCDIDRLTDELVASRDPRISYLIANGLITGPDYGWVWDSYDGSDPHTNHFHLSVVGDGRADDPRPWDIATAVSVPGKDDREMRTLMRYKGSPHVFLTDGLIARWIRNEAEIADLRTLGADGSIRLGNGGQVRIVTREELIGRIIGPVPAEWEDYADSPVTITDQQLFVLAAEVAKVLGARMDDVDGMVGRIVSALVAAGNAAGTVE